MYKQAIPSSVALVHCADYSPTHVKNAVGLALDASGWHPPRGRILVKPNLLRAVPLACTHPQVTAAACAWLLDQGAHPVVADSPGFGTARSVAKAIGLTAALLPLGLRVCSLDSPLPVRLGSGGSWGVARMALEADAILSLPKVKAHTQMRVTAAIKNLFGCVCGLEKPLAHARQGTSLECFTDGIVDLWRALPPVAALADGVEAMHVTGPAGGGPYALNCLGASASAVALDTALYRILGLTPERTPLWAALLRANVADALENPHYPLCRLEDFPCEDFLLPENLLDISFQPSRLLWSMARRCWNRLFS